MEHERDVAASPELYFLGLTWQRTRGSAPIGFLKDDIAQIGEPICAYRSTVAASHGEAVGSAAGPEVQHQTT